ncbi:hypothetical protein GQ54DRAFT_295786 [Martensiomyces pterosporus]|nr:hypothetical protein GQ54DRAFT_295786 [Martensiomyces pterosporus]
MSQKKRRSGKELGASKRPRVDGAAEEERALAAANEQPLERDAGTSTTRLGERKTRSRCVRCRLLNAKCNHTWPQCDTCKRASVHCMFFPLTGNDRLFGNFPRHASFGNFTRLPMAQRQSRLWTRMGAAAREFLSEQPRVHVSEDMRNITENPLRRKADNDRLAKLLSGPLKAAIERCSEEADEMASPLPLPSSELLGCINKAVVGEEASGSTELQSLNESMSGSALLALGEFFLS